MTQSANIQQPQKLDQDGRRRLVTVLLYLGLEMAILFVAAGRLDWTAAWVYTGARLLTLLVFGIWIVRVNPQLINERGRKPDEKTKPWDKVFAAVFVPTLFVTPLVAGLDAGRFGWSSMALGWQLIGFVALIPAMILPYWAMAVNPFLVTTVRLQDERGQYAVSRGPYRWVRHPMYTGMVFMAAGAPLLLGSWWAFVPMAVATVAVVGRTALEDRTLQAELPGYAEFAQRTRYRLLPGIW